MGRTHSAAEEAILFSRNFKVYYRLFLSDVPTFDIYFVSGSIETQVGQPLMSATFNLHIGKGSTSLSPMLSTGLRNSAGNGPALAVGATIKFQTACTPAGQLPDAYWRTVFIGRIDTYNMDSQQDLITVQCRDMFSLYQDWWVDRLVLTEDGYQYGFPMGAFRVDQAMQIVADFTTSGGPVIIVDGIPALGLSEFWQESMGLLDALRRLGVTTTGWDLRGRWDRQGILDAYDLVYYNPDREMTQSNVVTVSAGDLIGPHYYSIKFTSSILNVRNVCDVVPADDVRQPERIEDPDSIAKYGRRFAGLSEDLSSHIDTPDEAKELAKIMALDLSTPPVDVNLEMPYYWLFELNDLFQIAPDNFSYDSNEVFAVSGITHTFGEEGEPSTTVTGSLAARSATREWLAGRKRLNYVKLTEPSGPGKEGDIWCQTDDLTLPTVL